MKTIRIGKTLLLPLLVAGLMTLSASADVTQITMGGTADQVTFTTIGGNATTLTVGWGTCVAGTCTVGAGSGGIGTGALASGPAAWSFSIAQSSVIEITHLGSGLWAVSRQDTAISFSYADGFGNSLFGDLWLLNFDQTPGSQTGEFNTLLQANLINLSGTLAGVFTPAGGIARITLDFPNTTNITTLLAGGSNAPGTISTTFDKASITPTPEPGTMLLFGSGLAALGGYLRRRKR